METKVAFRSRKAWIRAAVGAAAGLCALWSGALAAQDKTYCLSIDYSKVPTLVNHHILTVNVNVGSCASVSVTADGVAIPAGYNASTQVASFSTSATAIAVTALNWTAGGTGAATKATLYNNFHWAYSQTFDDVRQSQYDYAKPLLDGLGLKAGISAVGSWLDSGNNYYMTWTEVKALLADGWDVYNHTWDHPDPVQCSTWVNEFGQNQTAFQTELPGYYVAHSVFPYEVSVATCSGYPPTYIISGELDNGPAYTQVSSPLSGANTLTVARNGIYGIDGAVVPGIENNCSNAANGANPAWVIYITHSITQGDGAAADQYSTNQNTLTTIYNYLLSNWGPAGKNTMWFAPAGTVQDYLFVRDNAVISTCTAPTPVSTPSASSSPSPSESPSPSASPSSTPSRTSTPSPSPSSSPSGTATGTSTPTGTRTGTPTGTPTSTASATASATDSPLPTATPSFSATPTERASSTETPQPSATASAVAPTSTPALSPEPSATASAVAATSTPALSPEPSATVSAVASATSSPAASATWTATASPTWTATASATWTATASPTRTATASATWTATASPTWTATAGATWTATASPTRTATTSGTPSPQSTSVPTRATATVPAGGPLVVQGIFGVPDPNPYQLAVDLAGPADALEVRIYTKSLVLALDFRTGPLGIGWNPVALPSALGRLPNGLYYVQVRADRGQAVSQSRFTRIMVLR